LFGGCEGVVEVVGVYVEEATENFALVCDEADFGADGGLVGLAVVCDVDVFSDGEGVEGEAHH